MASLQEYLRCYVGTGLALSACRNAHLHYSILRNPNVNRTYYSDEIKTPELTRIKRVWIAHTLSLSFTYD